MKRYSVIGRLYNATRYSLNGLICAFRQEQAFEYETVVLVVLLAVVLWARMSFLSSLAVIGAWLLVMALELVNGAVERAFNLISRQIDPEIKAGKDMLSAAVFLAIAFNVALWIAFLLIRVPFFSVY
ncbi:MAG: diacylglycerol kinase [Synergistaceae bacterium]|jgi:diacylglycerol kinase (ATP)|nr:diacylglycerol kinase [Synergistaceae bacterium]